MDIQDYLKGAVGFLWIINIILLVVYAFEEKVSVLFYITLAFVIATGVVPMARAFLMTRGCLKNDKDKTSAWAYLHTVCGVVATAGSGLLLGEAAQCGQESYDHIELLIGAAVVNGLSGVAAHWGFIDENEQSDLYDDSKPKSYALKIGDTPSLTRVLWYLVIVLCSLGSGFWINGYKNMCDHRQNLMFLSPIIHIAAFIVLALLSYGREFEFVALLNFPIMHISAILSMFGLMLHEFAVGDWLIVVPVYAFLALSHLKN